MLALGVGGVFVFGFVFLLLCACAVCVLGSPAPLARALERMGSAPHCVIAFDG